MNDSATSCRVATIPRQQLLTEMRRGTAMGYRFWRRVKIAPGVTLNLSKSGGSLSFGPRGAKFTVGPRGKRVSLGIPGTGLFYTTSLSEKQSHRRSGNSRDTASGGGRNDRLTLGFFKRLVTPAEEEDFVDGCRSLAQGEEEKAYRHFKKATHLPDGAYMAGFLALKRSEWDKAVLYLTEAVSGKRRPGRYFSKYGISPALDLPVTEEVYAAIDADLRGVLLGLVEAYQKMERPMDALRCLERLRRLEPDDVVVRLSLAELLLEINPEDKNTCRRVVKLAGNIKNESSVHAGLMLYKARALQRLGLTAAARDTLTAALRRRKDRPAYLLQALRYERALVYENIGQKARARKELELLYAADPEYKDVAKKLGL